MLFSSPLPLAREVRADRYGIRTFVTAGSEHIKLEIIAEGRIGLTGQAVPGIDVVCLDPNACFAEKLLANADRWRDDAVASRDLIDLAFMITHWPAAAARAGLATAMGAYGAVVTSSLERAVERWRSDQRYARDCIRRLSVIDEARLSKGILRLASSRWRRPATQRTRRASA